MLRTKLFPLLVIILVLAGGSSAGALAQQSERFGPFELHYSVVNTTFLKPEVAAAYGITRGKRRAILNLALREVLDDDSVARTMLLKGRTRDLLQKGQELEFQEIREGQSIYYIAEFKFINEEWRFFEIDFRPEGTDKTLSYKFKQQMYTD